MDTLKQLIESCDKIVFFGGAGVSTESGIPDFRSQDGLYNTKYKYPPETILSHTFFINNPSAFYDFHKTKIINPSAKPNKAHYALTELEKSGKLKAIITQNIDGFHQMAGSKNVLELHGSIHRNYCMICNRRYGLDTITSSTDVPICECGGIIRPDVVLYEETLDYGVMESAIKYIARAEMLIVGGTSLRVYPAAGLLQYYRGDMLVLINREATPMDHIANIVINGSIGEVLSEAVSV